MFDLLNSIMQVDAFDTPWTEWQAANAQYIDPVKVAQDVIALVECKQSKDLGYITDIWTQAVVYYYIWITYGTEVPHNDFADFFSNTKQIMELVA